MKRAEVDEKDLVLISALQDAPRASWAELSPVLQMSEETLAERWRRLRSSGLAWIGLLDKQHVLENTHTFVLLQTRIGHSAEVVNQLMHHPLVLTIHRISGSHNVSLLLQTEDNREAEWFITGILEGIGGISGLQVLPAVGIVTSGAAWRTAALSGEDRKVLARIAARSTCSASEITDPQWVQRDAVASALVEELQEDGRITSAELVRRLHEHHDLESSASTVSRKISKILGTSGVLMRCDISAGELGWQAVVMLWARIPSQSAAELWSERSSTAATVHRLLPEVRSFILLAGPVNLHVTVWLHRLESLSEVEARLAQWIPALEIHDRSVVYSTPKRMGWMLKDGRRMVSDPTR